MTVNDISKLFAFFSSFFGEDTEVEVKQYDDIEGSYEIHKIEIEFFGDHEKILIK